MWNEITTLTLAKCNFWDAKSGNLARILSYTHGRTQTLVLLCFWWTVIYTPFSKYLDNLWNQAMCRRCRHHHHRPRAFVSFSWTIRVRMYFSSKCHTKYVCKLEFIEKYCLWSKNLFQITHFDIKLDFWTGNIEIYNNKILLAQNEIYSLWKSIEQFLLTSVHLNQRKIPFHLMQGIPFISSTFAII